MRHPLSSFKCVCVRSVTNKPCWQDPNTEVQGNANYRIYKTKKKTGLLKLDGQNPGWGEIRYTSPNTQ